MAVTWVERYWVLGAQDMAIKVEALTVEPVKVYIYRKDRAFLPLSPGGKGQ